MPRLLAFAVLCGIVLGLVVGNAAGVILRGRAQDAARAVTPPSVRPIDPPLLVPAKVPSAITLNPSVATAAPRTPGQPSADWSVLRIEHTGSTLRVFFEVRNPTGRPALLPLYTVHLEDAANHAFSPNRAASTQQSQLQRLADSQGDALVEAGGVVQSVLVFDNLDRDDRELRLSGIPGMPPLPLRP